MYALAIALILVSPFDQSGSKTLVPEALDRFNGYEWSEIHLNETSDKELKAMYKCSKGAFRPEAIVISQPKGAATEVQAITNARGDKALVCGIRIAYVGNGPDMNDLAQKFGVAKSTWYPVTRYDNWHIEVIERHGIVAFVDESQNGGTRYVLLCSPANVDSFTSTMRSEPTEVSDFRDLRDLFSEPILVSDISVTLFSSDLSFANRFGMEQDLVECIRSLRSTRYLDFGRGRGGGKCSATTTVTYNKETGGTVSTNATLSVQTLMGKIEVSETGTDRIEKMGDRPELRRSRMFERSVDRAVRNAAEEVDRRIKSMIPKQPEDLHDDEFNKIINLAIPVGKKR